jgi:diacylglycerol kinase family enzyme
MKVLVLLNAAAGTLAASKSQDEADRLRARFAHHGVEADVRAVPGPELVKLAREARDSRAYDLVVAGGGDGTLNAVGSQLVGGDVEFAVLPLGTLNHLAKEVGMPEDLDASVDALVTGRTIDLSVGEVNGQVFLLFCAIGLYSDVVRHRDAQRKSLGRAKWTAMAVAYCKMIARWPLMRVRIKTGGQSFRRLTPLVYVGVSDHQLKLMGLEETSCGGRDALNVYLAAKPHRRGLVWMAIKAMIHRLHPGKDFELLCTDELEVSPHRRHVRVGYDGEVTTLESPLRFRRIKAGLRMRVPAAPQDPPPVERPS